MEKMKKKLLKSMMNTEKLMVVQPEKLEELMKQQDLDQEQKNNWEEYLTCLKLTLVTVAMEKEDNKELDEQEIWLQPDALKSLEDLEEKANSFIRCIEKKTVLAMMEYFTFLQIEPITASSSGQSGMETTSTSSTTVRTPTDRAGASQNMTDSRSRLAELYKRKVSQKKTSCSLSSINLQEDGKSTKFESEMWTTPDFLISFQVYEMSNVRPALIGTQEMWKDAYLRAKFYGTTSNDDQIFQQMTNLAADMIETIHQRNQQSDQEEVPTKKRRSKSSRRD